MDNYRFEFIPETEEGMKRYLELENGTQFIYQTNSYDFFAIKITDEVASFINLRNKFIKADYFKNMLSIGSDYITEYNSFQELIEGKIQELIEGKIKG